MLRAATNILTIAKNSFPGKNMPNRSMLMEHWSDCPQMGKTFVNTCATGSMRGSNKQTRISFEPVSPL